ncbi:trypsin-like peptidase domain-containing protein [Halobacillus yeomjeoni]|uniref:trypsin-like peptidase domain-containing protein n=1 Tax=Halobacillus yeomjeoni TaxID=311194 RepID=UPI001CD2D084|nr:trypsin-like peptidase domain-containing protein [Halobacillus yeomjeoni]MCA0984235.1 trypsin-like peptidase domain-containing protein [Halobacillus yeomjeoni]
MLCPKCQSSNTDQARFCVQCGHSMTPSSKKHIGWLFVIVVSFCLVWTGVIYYYFENKKELVEVTNEPQPAEVVETTVEKPKTDSDAEKTSPTEKDKDAPSTAPKPDTPEGKEKKEIIDKAQGKVYTILTDHSQGSGFLFKKNGTVVTNAHVVAGFTDVQVRNRNGSQMSGKVIGISNVYDVALIRVDQLAGQSPLPIETKKSKVGTEVIALGTPLGLENTASIGYLTGVDRSFEEGFKYENAYQIDAQISPGSSGGPLLDGETGKVIGINSARLNADSSIGFSIPMYTMTDQLNSWSNAPMSTDDVINAFAIDNSMDDYDFGEEYEEEPYEDDYPSAFDEASLSAFIIEFRNNYELALEQEDFSYIEPYLEYESTAYRDLYEYLHETFGKGMIFEFTQNQVTNVEIQNDYAIVSTFETFDFMNAAGEWSVYERIKDYVVVMDEFDRYMIRNIEIHQ